METEATGALSPSGGAQLPPAKKQRALAGMTESDAEVIWLSPAMILGRKRFVCKECGKRFVREQDLRMHHDEHDLPWKVAEEDPGKAPRRRLYLCPALTCVHHDPARAFGDLTALKKHFFLKHGGKKWRCDKCSKACAVPSDWMEHIKTCTSREYRCDCGTLFSRKDNFITHRAFCDALPQESANVPASALREVIDLGVDCPESALLHDKAPSLLE